MQFKIFVFIALVLTVFVAQGEAGWLKKVGKKIVSSTLKIYFIQNF